jgi:hypothetical protein
MALVGLDKSIHICGVYMVLLAEKSPDIRSYTVYIYGVHKWCAYAHIRCAYTVCIYSYTMCIYGVHIRVYGVHIRCAYTVCIYGVHIRCAYMVYIYISSCYWRL